MWNNFFKNSTVHRVLFLISFISLVTFLSYYPFFIHGKSPLPYDIPVGMYYPWLNHKYGYAVQAPVKNPLISDTVSQFWIWRNRAVEDLLGGHTMIWNPYSLSGYELSPWFHSLLYSPLNLFYLFLPTTAAMSWIVVSQTIISLLGAYLLGELLFKSKIVSVSVSLLWTFSSFFLDG